MNKLVTVMILLSFATPLYATNTVQFSALRSTHSLASDTKKQESIDFVKNLFKKSVDINWQFNPIIGGDTGNLEAEKHDAYCELAQKNISLEYATQLVFKYSYPMASDAEKTQLENIVGDAITRYFQDKLGLVSLATIYWEETEFNVTSQRFDFDKKRHSVITLTLTVSSPASPEKVKGLEVSLVDLQPVTSAFGTHSQADVAVTVTAPTPSPGFLILDFKIKGLSISQPINSTSGDSGNGYDEELQNGKKSIQQVVDEFKKKYGVCPH